VVYPGSIERVDFGEVKDEKFFVIAEVARGETRVDWRQLREVRPFVDQYLRLNSQEGIAARLCAALPAAEAIAGAVVRLTVEYPREWEPLIDESSLREHTAGCFEFHLIKRPLVDARIRLPDDSGVGSLPPLELLNLYWRAVHTDPDEIEALGRLASEVIAEADRELGV
jgi:exonuclease SbcD